MQTLSVAALEALRANVTTLAVCWRVERTDGELILGTEHDRDLEITTNSTDLDLTGAYSCRAGITGSAVRSSSDMSVDNVDVSGAVNQGDLTIADLSAADIEAGLFDDASVTLFIVSWTNPDLFQLVYRTGNVGEISRTSDGEYRTELRGLAQRLIQNIIDTYSPSCDAELGDSRCRVDVNPLTALGTVTAVTSPRQFALSLTYADSPLADGFYDGGEVEWLTGDNATYRMEVKLQVYQSPDDMLLYLPMPNDVQVGDTCLVRPGCDKTPGMCKLRFNNLVNFRGHGAWVPGIGETLAFGGAASPKPPFDVDKMFQLVIRGAVTIPGP